MSNPYPHRWTPERTQALIDMRHEGATDQEIADTIEVSRHAVARKVAALRKSGVDVPESIYSKSKRDAERIKHDDKIIALYQEGYGFVRISRILQISKHKAESRGAALARRGLITLRKAQKPCKPKDRAIFLCPLAMKPEQAATVAEYAERRGGDDAAWESAMFTVARSRGLV